MYYVYCKDGDRISISKPEFERIKQKIADLEEALEEEKMYKEPEREGLGMFCTTAYWPTEPITKDQKIIDLEGELASIQSRLYSLDEDCREQKFEIFKLKKKLKKKNKLIEKLILKK